MRKGRGERQKEKGREGDREEGRKEGREIERGETKKRGGGGRGIGAEVRNFERKGGECCALR